MDRSLTLKTVVIAAALAFGGGTAEAKKLFRGAVAAGISKAGHSAARTVKHAGNEIGNGVENVGEAVTVAGYTVDRQQRAARENLGKAGERLKDGKVLKAFGGFAVDQAKATERNMLRAAQESSALRMGMQVGAGVALGPAGTGAVQTWYVGRTTGSVEKGLKVGVISAGSSAASGALSAPAATTGGQIAAKAAANATISGTAVAASGGKFEDGAFQGAVTSVAYDSYRNYTGHAPDGRSGDKPSVPKGANEAACKGVAGCKVVFCGCNA